MEAVTARPGEPTAGLGRARGGERGQIIVLFTLAFVVMLAVAAVVIDLGLLRTDGARLQNALDASSLAAADSMPTTSANVASVNAIAMRYLNQNFSGNWSLQPITYRCIVGANTATNPPLPRTTDMPSACKVSFAANSSSWRCTGVLCWAPCDPVHNPTDVCNTIVLAANTTRSFSFGRALGITSGTTAGSNTGSDGGSPGNMVSVACSGLCGQAPTAPLDVVLIVDRTTSMSAAMSSLRQGANAVLQAYNPAIQRIAFGALGPSSLYSSCGSPATNVNSMVISTPGVTYGGSTSATNLTNSTIWASTTSAQSGSSVSSLTITAPASIAAGDVLVAAIAVGGGSGTTITAPTGWTLMTRTDNSSLVSVASYYRVATAAEGASYKWTFGASIKAVGAITRYVGVDSTTPVDVKGPGATNAAGSTAAAAPAVTTTAANDRVIGFYAMSSATTFTAPAAMAERMDLSVPSGTTLEVADEVKAAAGTTGIQTATAAASGRWATHRVALRPAITGSSSLTIAKPGAPVADDVLVAGVSVAGGSGTTITAPSGWTLIRRTDNGASVSVATYYHVVTGAEGASFAWTIGGSAKASGTISLYSNVDTSSVLDPSAAAGAGGTGSTGSSTSPSAAAVSTTTTYTQDVGFYASSASTVFTSPSGMTERSDTAFSGSAGPTLETSDVQDVAAGSTGVKTATASVSATWVAQLFALRAAPVDIYGTDPTNPLTLQSWIPLGFSGTDTGTPTFTAAGVRGYNEVFSSGGAVAAGSHIAQAIGCFDMSGTGTNLATPIDMADYYLMHYGRTGARKGIIIETDGTPGSCPASLSTAICNEFTNAAAQSSADAAKADGITLFTIGYGGSGGVDATLLGNMASTKVGTSTCTDAENTDGDAFFCTPTATELASVFQAAAAALASAPHLVQLYATPIVTAVSPASGSKAGGATVTVTGQNLGDAYSVTFSGVAASFTVTSQTSIAVTIPSRAATGVVDIQVSTPGGTSSLVTGDQFTYN